jgi:hypothetical protein
MKSYQGNEDKQPTRRNPEAAGFGSLCKLCEDIFVDIPFEREAYIHHEQLGAVRESARMKNGFTTWWTIALGIDTSQTL